MTRDGDDCESCKRERERAARNRLNLLLMLLGDKAVTK